MTVFIISDRIVSTVNIYRVSQKGCNHSQIKCCNKTLLYFNIFHINISPPTFTSNNSIYLEWFYWPRSLHCTVFSHIVQCISLWHRSLRFWCPASPFLGKVNYCKHLGMEDKLRGNNEHFWMFSLHLDVFVIVNLGLKQNHTFLGNSQLYEHHTHTHIHKYVILMINWMFASLTFWDIHVWNVACEYCRCYYL